LDREFVSYICKKEDEYKEGAEINPNALMLLADNKFKTFKQAETWNAPSLEEEKILALEMQIQTLRKERKKPKQQENKKGKDKDGTKKGKRNKKKDSPKWMQVLPADANKDKPKTVKGKQYYCCAKHSKWAGHITSACQGKGLKDPKTNQQQEPPPSPQTTACLGLTRALSTLGVSDSE